jgi:hypothetical protein
MTQIDAEFTVTEWTEHPDREMAGEPEIGQVTIGKTFRGGLAGTSVTTMLATRTDGGAGYVAMERFTGSIAGRAGSVVFQHWGTDNEGDPATAGHIIPGTGSGELAGLTGRFSYRHDDSGARISMQATFPDGSGD